MSQRRSSAGRCDASAIAEEPTTSSSIWLQSMSGRGWVIDTRSPSSRRPVATAAATRATGPTGCSWTTTSARRTFSVASSTMAGTPSQ
ncbi:hypothetical protein [Nocardioides sp. KR10-350]|uniref:hypothetical protein n=1 Tax=Nocardioides cheoyonin TaxID=3156615 RepID=UPI0032B3E64A